MSNVYHLNLLQPEEHLSSSPIRLRVMLPMFSLLSALGVGVWWSVLAGRVHAVTQQKSAIEANLAQLKPTHETVLGLRTEQHDLTATLEQLAYYTRAQLRFGPSLQALAHHVPDQIQLTELHIPPPPEPPPPDPKNPVWGPTNPIERVTLRLTGRTTGASQVETLLRAFRTEAFTNLIRSAQIPKGAYRQDTTRRGAAKETLLFELNCECALRRFE